MAKIYKYIFKRLLPEGGQEGKVVFINKEGEPTWSDPFLMVENIAERDLLDKQKGLIVFVKDASGDPDLNINVGADYFWDGEEWQRKSFHDNIQYLSKIDQDLSVGSSPIFDGSNIYNLQINGGIFT